VTDLHETGMPNHDTRLPSCWLFSGKHLSTENKLTISNFNTRKQICIAPKQKNNWFTLQGENKVSLEMGASLSI
jgi:hypothetical protein